MEMLIFKSFSSLSNLHHERFTLQCKCINKNKETAEVVTYFVLGRASHRGYVSVCWEKKIQSFQSFRMHIKGQYIFYPH